MNATVEGDEQIPRGKVELEREGEEIRADMDRTLDALERKFSPDQWVDRSVEFLRENGAEFAHEIGETVRNHPVPVFLTAAGLIWLTSSISRSRTGESTQRTQNLTGRPQQRHRTERAGETDRPSVERVKDKVRDSMSSVQERTQRARSNFAAMVEEQPLAFGAVAVATGALIGAALPMTQYENRIVGPLHDRTLSKAEEVGRRQYEKVRDTLTTDEGLESGVGGAEDTSH